MLCFGASDNLKELAWTLQPRNNAEPEEALGDKRDPDRRADVGWAKQICVAWSEQDHIKGKRQSANCPEKLLY